MCRDLGNRAHKKRPREQRPRTNFLSSHLPSWLSRSLVNWSVKLRTRCKTVKNTHTRAISVSLLSSFQSSSLSFSLQMLANDLSHAFELKWDTYKISINNISYVRVITWLLPFREKFNIHTIMERFLQSWKNFQWTTERRLLKPISKKTKIGWHQSYQTYLEISSNLDLTNRVARQQ